MSVLPLILVALIGQPETRYVYVQRDCPPCAAIERDVGYGDDSLLVLYVSITRADELPAGATGTPAVYDPATKRVSVGYQTLSQMKGVTVKPVAHRGYPHRATWWTHPGNIRQHFMATHAARFDQAWLAQLTDYELECLHSDIHEGRVKSQAVYAVQAAPKQAATGRWVKVCRNGVCRMEWVPN